MVEIATNSKGDGVCAAQVLKHCIPDKNQGTTTQYHISDHNLNHDISLSYNSDVGNIFRHNSSVFKLINMISS